MDHPHHLGDFSVVWPVCLVVQHLLLPPSAALEPHPWWVLWTSSLQVELSTSCHYTAIAAVARD